MNASETVIGLDELCYLKTEHVKKHETERPDIAEYVFAAINKQAEISFKLRTDDILRQLNEFNQRGLAITEAIALLQ